MSTARVGTGALARPDCVGTAALGCPAEQSSASVGDHKQLWVRDKRSMIRSRDPMIQRVATAVVLIPLVLLLVLKAPLYVLAIVAGAVALLAIVEFLKLVTHYAVQPLGPATYAFVAAFFVFVIVASTNRTPLVETTAILYGLALAASLAPFVFLTVAMRMKRSNLTSGYPAAAASTFAFVYIAIPMALLVATPAAAGGSDLDDLHAARRVGGRHLRLLRGQVAGAASHVARDQPEEDLGRRGGLGPGQRDRRHAVDSARDRNQFRAAAGWID